MSRNVPEKASNLKTFTFSTGREIMIKRVSPLLTAELHKAFPPPKPPMQEGVEGRMEPNPAHPDHIEALERHASEMSDRSAKLLIRRGIVIDKNEDVSTEVADLRQDMNAMGVVLDEDDDYVYVMNLCVGSSDDIVRLYNEIMGDSQPTEVEIENANATF